MLTNVCKKKERKQVVIEEVVHFVVFLFINDTSVYPLWSNYCWHCTHFLYENALVDIKWLSQPIL